MNIGEFGGITPILLRIHFIASVLGGLTIYQVANFLECIFTKNFESWLAVDKGIAIIEQLTFLSHPV